MQALTTLGAILPIGPTLSKNRETLFYSLYHAICSKTIFIKALDHTTRDYKLVRMLSELSTTGLGVSDPWLSEDGLRLYYQRMHEVLQGYGGRIKMATRQSVDHLWTPQVRTFMELHPNDALANAPSLTADELCIVVHSPRADGSVGILIATRNTMDDAFSNIRYLDELGLDGGRYCPDISPDGLTLYYHSNGKIYRAKRLSLDAPFGGVLPLDVAPQVWVLQSSPV